MNLEARPVGNIPFPEENVVITNPPKHGYKMTRRRHDKRSKGPEGNHKCSTSSNKRSNKTHQKWAMNAKDSICYRCGMDGHESRTCSAPKDIMNVYQPFVDSICYRCGMEGHESRTCSAPEDIYQPLLKSIAKDSETHPEDVVDSIKVPTETHPVDVVDPVEVFEFIDFTDLDMSEFFDDPSGGINHPIGNENVYKD